MSKKIVSMLISLLLIFGTFNVVYADTTIRLSIQTSSGSLYNQDITVTACDSDNTGGMAETAYCAVLQSDVANNWSWYGADAFLNTLGGTANDYVNNIYWGWFHDLVYGDTAMSAHALTEGENILLSFNINPLKLAVSDSNPSQHDTVTAMLEKFGLDSNYNPIWTPAVDGSVIVNGVSHGVDSNGKYSFAVDSTSPYVISGSQSGFIDSSSVTLNPTPVRTGGGGATGGGGGALASLNNITVKNVAPEFDVAKAVGYLKNVQDNNGSFGGADLYSDWAAIAYGATDISDSSRDKLIFYFNSHSTLSLLLTDNERRAMALLSLGQNPYSFNGVNYIKAIADAFDGAQFGDPSFVNDDIFALIPLQNAGYKADDEIIVKGIDFIISKQKSDGSWNESVDLTGASIETLSSFGQNEQVKTVLTKAKNFLKQNQKDDGGWGNVSATAWAMEGILALGEKPEDWVKNPAFGETSGYTPIDYLAFNQDVDGGMKNNDVKNKIWETSYAISVLSGRSWNQAMQKFEKPKITEIPATISAAEAAEKPEVKKTETRKITKKTNSPRNISPDIKKLENNLAAQNLATSIAAVENIPIREEIPAPAPKRSWLRKLFDIIFGF